MFCPSPLRPDGAGIVAERTGSTSERMHRIDSRLPVDCSESAVSGRCLHIRIERTGEQPTVDFQLHPDAVKAGLSTPFHKYAHVCCVAFRFWRGATREHPPKWGCDRGATKPEPKSDATLRATGLFGSDVVARSLQTLKGYARRSRLVWAKNPSSQTWSYL